MIKNCKTCKKCIPIKERAYSCVSCNSQMHMTPECTALLPTAKDGLKETGLNAMLLCNASVENNERDNFIRCRTLANANEIIENLDVGAKLKNMR